jgi:hypothetical protein
MRALEILPYTTPEEHRGQQQTADQRHKGPEPAETIGACESSILMRMPVSCLLHASHMRSHDVVRARA